jgi:hypothetical protein
LPDLQETIGILGRFGFLTLETRCVFGKEGKKEEAAKGMLLEREIQEAIVWFGVGLKDSWIPYIRNVYGEANTVASIKIISIRVNVIGKSFFLNFFFILIITC